MSDETLDLNDDNGPEIRRPMRGRPPNVAKLSNGEDPRARAEQRIAEIRAQKEGREEDGVDEFKAPPAPEGWEYQWRTKTVFEKPMTSHMNNLLRNGWSEVPASRHPDFLSYGSTSQSIEHLGMVLMECPKELVKEARDADARRARMQVNAKAAQLDGAAPDTMLANQTDRTARKLNRTFAPIPIPE